MTTRRILTFLAVMFVCIALVVVVAVAGAPKLGGSNNAPATEEPAVAGGLGTSEGIREGEFVPTASDVNSADRITADEAATMIGNTDTVSELITQLNKAWEINPEVVGGAWTEEQAIAGYTVPAGSIFWTDLYENVNALPAGVTVIRTDGGWGVFKTTVAYRVPLPNGGGRYASIDGRMTEVTTLSIAEATANACIDQPDLDKIANADDPIKAYNDYFEAKGYGFGKSLGNGETAPKGSIFLGTFPENAVPTTVHEIAGGYIWAVNENTVAPNGGRYMVFCN
jgi:hypothetical protein